MKRDRYSPSEQTLRLILRKHRLARGLRQEDLAQMLQVHQSFVSKYESGERLLTFVEVMNICKVIGIQPLALVKEYQKHNKSK